MLQVTPQTRILVATEPADFRKGIDGLARLCKEALQEDPFSGAVFVFRNRSAKALKVLVYDGQGFWLCQKRLSQGKFRFWPRSGETSARPFQAHELHVLFRNGNPFATMAQEDWRRIPQAG